MVNREIHKLSTERSRLWSKMSSWNERDVEQRRRVVDITRQLNGHAEDLGYYSARSGGLYGDKRTEAVKRFSRRKEAA